MRKRASPALDVHPLTPGRWADLVTLFSGRGGSQVRGCWCMYYRFSGHVARPPGVTPADHNRQSLKSLVDRGTVPGLIGYRDGKPIAWVSLAPRDQYAKLAKSTVMKPVDDKPTWSIVCFYTAQDARGEGVAATMLASALAYARDNGARLVEAYPIDKDGRGRDDSMWFGTKPMYDRAGFCEVARRKPARPVVRKVLRPASR